MRLNDSHCHFFSTRFFNTLAAQRGGSPPASGDDVCRELGWDPPGSAESLADRWVAELDAHGVSRAALMASVPRDEASVVTAVARHPRRLVGLFMLDPSLPDAAARARLVVADGLRGICLFPAMHHVAADDERVMRIAEVAAEHPGTVLFVHCGMLSIGVRRRLGLPSAFDLRLGDPLALARLAHTFPRLPLIVPHFGAGRLRDTLMLADTCANVHLDTSSSNGWIRYTPGLTLEGVFRAALTVAGPSRLLFGTDSSFFPRGWQRGILAEQQAIAERLGLSDDDRARLFGGNFDRLFPLEA